MQFFCALKFFFGDSLTWNDVLDWHNVVILPLPRLPQGGGAKALLKPNIDLENRHSHQPTSPLPMLALSLPKGGKGGGIGRISSLPFLPLASLGYFVFPRPFGLRDSIMVTGIIEKKAGYHEY